MQKNEKKEYIIPKTRHNKNGHLFFKIFFFTSTMSFMCAILIYLETLLTLAILHDGL